MKSPRVIEFWQFCDKVLGLKLTTGQRVIAKIAFGDDSPADLEGDERDLALAMFGDVEVVPDKAKRFVCLLLGRGSGKTTMCAAYAVYVAVCQPFKVGPGDTPYVVTIAPDLATAKLSIAMSREMIRSNPALERLVVSDEKQSIAIRRPTGEQVKIESFAAARGGSTVRGRTILAFLMDEAQFMTSNGDGSASYSVSDTDIFRALKPRLIRHGKGMLISTPWPVETLMQKMFEENWKNPVTAVAIKGPTLLVRGEDPDIAELVRDEMERDPENGRRELFCEIDGISGDGFFDLTALAGAVKDDLHLPGAYNPLWPTVAAADLGFKNDSSTLAIVQYDGRRYVTVSLTEMRPKPGAPLKPSEVIAKFAEVAKRYGCTYIVSDGHYRESVKEHLQASGLALVDAPEGVKGKQESFSRVRSVLHEGLVVLPKSDLVTRLVAQAKMVTAKPAAGGSLTIRIPRKVGLGHGDLVSAWVCAVYKLAYSRVKESTVELEYGSNEYQQESARRLAEYWQKQLAKSLRDAEAEVHARTKGRRRGDGILFGRVGSGITVRR